MSDPQLDEWLDFLAGHDDGPPSSNVVPIRPQTSPQSEEGELVFLSARDFMQLPEPAAASPVVGELFARGQRVMMIGHSGHGKSSLINQVIGLAIKGGKFLDTWEAPGGARVLLIQADQGVTSTKFDIHEMKLTESADLDILYAYQGLTLEDPECRAEVESSIEAGNYSMIVCDALYKLTELDENANAEMGRLMKVFDAWKTRFNCCVVVHHHARKPGKDSRAAHSYSGGTTLVRGTEVELNLTRKGEGKASLYFGKLRERITGARQGDTWSLDFDPKTGFTRSDDEGSTNEESPAKQYLRDRIADIRADEPTLTQQQVADRLGCHKRTVQRWWSETEPPTLELLGDDDLPF